MSMLVKIIEIGYTVDSVTLFFPANDIIPKDSINTYNRILRDNFIKEHIRGKHSVIVSPTYTDRI